MDNTYRVTIGVWLDLAFDVQATDELDAIQKGLDKYEALDDGEVISEDIIRKSAYLVQPNTGSV